MAAPVWFTDPGNLGTIREGEFYELKLDAGDPGGNMVLFSVISGFMPPGLSLASNGLVFGRPRDRYLIRGVPFTVDQDVTSTFSVRATNTATGQVTDRTFSLTVTGQNPPQILTASKELARVIDGTFVDVQIEAIDIDNDPITYRVSKGELPPGLTLDRKTGRISGYVEPALNTVQDETVGWSSPSAGWQEFPWDHGTTWKSQNYQFSIEVDDGKERVQRSYTIFVFARNLLTADSTDLTADDVSLITADTITRRAPVMITTSQDFGFILHDNYFSYQFKARDFDQDRFLFGISATDGLGFDNDQFGYDQAFFDQGQLSLPPGLKFSPETGWLYGYIPRQTAAQLEYNFSVYAYKRDDPSIRSAWRSFTITTVGDLANAVRWDSPSDLGTIESGQISELRIQASNEYNMRLSYSLEGNIRLPQGLKLLSNGLIVGRPVFEQTTFDNGETTFDINIRELGSRLTPVTFDRQSRFVVKAESPNGELLSRREFTITVLPSNRTPTENLILRAQPGQETKNLILTLTNNTDILPGSVIYRSGDPYFGRAQNIEMLLLGGINAATPGEYISAMQQNHYRKRITLSDVKLDKAYDENRNLVYEVLYFDLGDDQANDNGSTARKRDLTGKINRNITTDSSKINVDSALLKVDGDGDKTIYPNSFRNMRRQIIDNIGMPGRETLPLWMRCRQPDGRVIGWKPAAVIAYLQPGTGERVLFNLRRFMTFEPWDIDFEVDRYVWDTNLSRNYDSETGEYLIEAQTTFDKELKLNVPEPVDTVDFAVEHAFSLLDKVQTAQIDSLGGLDGITTVYEGRTIIFAKQESFGLLENDGWVKNIKTWDDHTGWDNSNTVGWNDSQTIPGYFENQNDPNIANQRAGIWRFTRNNDGLLTLEFVRSIEQGETLRVRFGAQYGGQIVKYDTLIRFSLGETVPRYRIAEAINIKPPTTFDNDGTRFIGFTSVYEDPDLGDKYLVFPKRHVWA